MFTYTYIYVYIYIYIYIYIYMFPIGGFYRFLYIDLQNGGSYIRIGRNNLC